MAGRALPFDDFRDLVNLVPACDERAIAAWRTRDAQLTKIPGSLGRLEEIGELFAGHTGNDGSAIRVGWTSTPSAA